MRKEETRFRNNVDNTVKNFNFMMKNSNVF